MPRNLVEKLVTIAVIMSRKHLEKLQNKVVNLQRKLVASAVPETGSSRVTMGMERSGNAMLDLRFSNHF
jgi:hypothetical protein